MGIRFSGVALMSAVALAGCAGDGGGSASPDYKWDSSADSDAPGPAIKMRNLRFDPAADAQGQRGGRWVHSYKFTLSRGWMTKRGGSPREPFEKVWRKDAYVGENIQDARMVEVLGKLDAAGFRELRETPLESINLQALLRIEQVNDAEAARKTRIITVETDTYRRTVTSYDNSDPASFKRFTDVERQVIIWLFANTVLVSKESQSTMPRERK